MLKAVILAGGRGLRLKPLTDTIPKPMVEIKGKPFLQYQLELLKKNKVLDILICVGYLKEKIIDYFSDGSKFGVRIEYSAEKTFLGTGGALKIAEKQLDKDFILLYGDSYLPIDYIALADTWSGMQGAYAGMVVCYDNKDTIAKNNIYLDHKNIVKRYDKRNPGAEMNYVEAGVVTMNREVLRLVSGGKAVSLEEEIFPTLIKDRKLKGYPTNQRYYDIGSMQGLKEIEGVL